jgi:gamma-glutamyltranspeptidase/glutathione hydrolase
VPGAVEAWYALHARFGRLPMPALLEPAIGYARDGFPVAPVAARMWADNGGFVDATRPEFAVFHATFMPGGRAPAAGERFRNPRMAASLASIAAGGPDALYRGPLGATIAQALRAHGGGLREADLAAHRGEWVEPVSVRYRGYDVHELPPNTQGGVVLQVLNLLQGYDLRAMGFGSVDHAHVLVEALKLAWEDRADFYADPGTAPPLARLLSPEYAAARRGLIDLAKARPTRSAVPHESHTTYLTVADRDGMMVSLISSLFDGFGSGIVPDGLGFALQSRGAGFSLLDGHPNAWAPGKRPLHTIIPAFVTRDGEPWFSFGVLGGSFQPQGHVQVLLNLIDFGMNAQEAGDAPRIAISGGPDPWNPAGGSAHRVHVEPGIADEVVAALRARGHDVRRGGLFFGGYNGIRRDPATGFYEAAAEMRLDATAAGY